MSSENIRLTREQAQYFYEQIEAVTVGRKSASITNRESVLRLRQIFEQVLKEASRGAQEPLPDTFKRSIYVLNETHAPRELIDVSHQFRKLANRTVHESEFDVHGEHVEFGAQTIGDLTEFLSDAPRPVRRQARVDLPVPATQWPAQIPLLRGVVTSQQLGDPLTFTCAVEEPEELGTLAIELDQNWKGTELPNYTTVALHGLQHVADGCYRISPEGLLVLHPDLLISSTSISECLGDKGASSMLYLMNKFRRTSASEAMLKGSVAGSMFSQAIRDPEIDPREAFRRASRESVLSFTRLGAGVDQTIWTETRDMLAVMKGSLTQLRTAQEFTEMTLLSASLGMQGRMDGVFIDPKAQRARVVELKGGKPLPVDAPITLPGFAESKGIRISHLGQALTYEMLMRSAMPQLSTSASLLYAKDKMIPLRDAKHNPVARRNLMKVRNAVAGYDWMLAQDAVKVVSRLSQAALPDAPPYLKEDIENLRAVLKKATPLETAYFTAYVGLVAREWLTARIGTTNPDAMSNGFARLWKDDLEAKERDFLAISSLVCSAYDADSRVVTFTSQRVGGMASTSLRTGDPVVLYRHERDLSADPLHGPLIRGIIHDIRAHEGMVAVSLNDAPVDAQMEGVWAVEPFLYENLYNYEFRALAQFLFAPPEKRRVLLGLQEPRFAPLATPLARVIPEMPGGTTSDQQHALLEHALSARDYFLLQGPPGTGKTSVMIRMMMNHLSNQTSENVLLLAFTNRAVEEICKAIEPICPFVKLGSGNNLKNPEYALDEYARAHGVPATREHIRKSRVFVATVASLLGRPELLEIKQFHTAIIDEASQLLEPHLAGILPYVGRFILIGDEKQLPAVITQSPEQARSADPELRALGIADEDGVTDLRTSLFERLLRVSERSGWKSYGMLEAQSRMHEKVQAFASARFYGGRLRPRAAHQSEKSSLFSDASEDSIERALATARVLFIPVRAQKGMRTNTGEAELVGQLLGRLHSHYMRHAHLGVPVERMAAETARRIGVITPFRAQISEIRRALPPDLQSSGIDIDTVERYQGSEREVIVVSFAVNHAMQIAAMQSLNQDGSVDRKLNVALTRAKEYMILVGVPEVLRIDPHYAALLDHIEATGGYMSSYSAEDMDF
jgi:DNA replication ATP-dependent helicase Dna2